MRALKCLWLNSILRICTLVSVCVFLRDLRVQDNFQYNKSLGRQIAGTGMLKITMLATPRLCSALTVCRCEWKGRCSRLSSTLRVAIVCKYSYRDEVSCNLRVVCSRKAKYSCSCSDVKLRGMEFPRSWRYVILQSYLDQRVEAQPHFPPVILNSPFHLRSPHIQILRWRFSSQLHTVFVRVHAVRDLTYGCTFFLAPG